MSLKISGQAGSQEPVDFDVAFFGGGIAGVYCFTALEAQSAQDGGAWTCLGRSGSQRHAELYVVLFEYRDRIGGRLFPLALPGLPNTLVELGGMRFLTSSPAIDGSRASFKSGCLSSAFRRQRGLKGMKSG